MKILTATAFFLISYLASSQVNIKALDSLLNAKSSILSGKGGGMTMILMKDDSVIYNHSTGNFSIDKAVPIASASKWYAGVLLMRLADEGKLKLQDKVSKYIPSFAGDKKDITILQCFALTSGMPGESETLDEFMALRNISFAQMVDEIAKVPLAAKPGTQLNYGGLAMQVVGRVCEIAGGKPWNELFKEKVVQPLGLKKTYYAGVNRGAVPRIAGGVISSAGDYLKLLNMLFHQGIYNGKRYLDEKYVHQMLSDQTANASIGFSPFKKFKSYMLTTNDPRYGIGNWVVNDGSIQINTSPGAFGFTPWIDKTGRYYGVISVRSAFPKVMPVFWQILKTVHQYIF